MPGSTTPLPVRPTSSPATLTRQTSSSSHSAVGSATEQAITTLAIARPLRVPKSFAQKAAAVPAAVRASAPTNKVCGMCGASEGSLPWSQHGCVECVQAAVAWPHLSFEELVAEAAISPAARATHARAVKIQQSNTGRRQDFATEQARKAQSSGKRSEWPRWFWPRSSFIAKHKIPPEQCGFQVVQEEHYDTGMVDGIFITLEPGETAPSGAWQVIFFRQSYDWTAVNSLSALDTLRPGQGYTLYNTFRKREVENTRLREMPSLKQAEERVVTAAAVAETTDTGRAPSLDAGSTPPPTDGRALYEAVQAAAVGGRAAAPAAVTPARATPVLRKRMSTPTGGLLKKRASQAGTGTVRIRAEEKCVLQHETLDDAGQSIAKLPLEALLHGSGGNRIANVISAASDKAIALKKTELTKMRGVALENHLLRASAAYLLGYKISQADSEDVQRAVAVLKGLNLTWPRSLSEELLRRHALRLPISQRPEVAWPFRPQVDPAEPFDPSRPLAARLPASDAEKVSAFMQIVIADSLAALLVEGPAAADRKALAALDSACHTCAQQFPVPAKHPQEDLVQRALRWIRAVAGLLGAVEADPVSITSTLQALKACKMSEEKPEGAVASVLRNPEWNQASAAYVRAALLEKQEVPKLSRLAAELSKPSLDAGASSAWDAALVGWRPWRMQLRPSVVEPLTRSMETYLRNLRATVVEDPQAAVAHARSLARALQAFTHLDTTDITLTAEETTLMDQAHQWLQSAQIDLGQIEDRAVVVAAMGAITEFAEGMNEVSVEQATKWSTIIIHARGTTPSPADVAKLRDVAQKAMVTARTDLTSNRDKPNAVNVLEVIEALLTLNSGSEVASWKGVVVALRLGFQLHIATCAVDAPATAPKSALRNLHKAMAEWSEEHIHTIVRFTPSLDAGNDAGVNGLEGLRAAADKVMRSAAAAQAGRDAAAVDATREALAMLAGGSKDGSSWKHGLPSDAPWGEIERAANETLFDIDGEQAAALMKKGAKAAMHSSW